jgi:2-(1,2-epoxy-1,2-dihydrophenyl)acetyl-CoA isomerase
MSAEATAGTQFEQIETEVVAGVLRITLNRPDALNPLSIKMADEIHAALDEAAADDDIRAILLTGAGRAFSSGADLSGTDARATEDGKPDVLTGLREVYNPLILAVRDLPKPVVAAVNGPCAGVGCSLALASDIIVAADSSYFLMAFANIGLTVDGGASAFLSARIGKARAAEMALLAGKVPAEKALDWGLVNQVVPGDQLLDEAGAIAEKFAAGPTLSYAATKSLLNSALYADLPEQLDKEAVAQQGCAESEDFGIGVMAFLSKQTAEFKGA